MAQENKTIPLAASDVLIKELLPILNQNFITVYNWLLDSFFGPLAVDRLSSKQRVMLCDMLFNGKEPEYLHSNVVYFNIDIVNNAIVAPTKYKRVATIRIKTEHTEKFATCILDLVIPGLSKLYCRAAGSNSDSPSIDAVIALASKIQGHLDDATKRYTHMPITDLKSLPVE